jgi:hypothetical protein
MRFEVGLRTPIPNNMAAIRKVLEDAGSSSTATKVAGRELDCESSAAAVGAEDAALLSSLRGRSVPTSSGRTEPSFCGRIGGHRSCGFVQVKRVSELDRLLQRNQSGGFASGTQLYDYLKAHKCVGLTAGRARVYSTRGQYVCIYDPKDNKMSIYPCAWTRREMLSK